MTAKEYQREWYIKNKERHQSLCKLNYIKTRENRLKTGRDYYKNNKEYISKKHKEYRELNKESLGKKHREYNKKYREKHKVELNKRKKERYKNNKTAHFAGQIKRKYGITIERYNELYTNQNGRCAICEVHQDKLKVKLSTDHCHSTGRVRGLLCFRCNTTIGQFKDDIILFKKAIKYLKKQ